jgi:uncharacterized protein (TIGR02246 family)
MDTARAEIEAANKELLAALSNGDAAGVASCYTEDAKLLPPNSEILEGKEAIQAFWQGGIDMGIKEAELKTALVEAQGDAAYEIGTYTLTIEPPGGPVITDKGKYLVIWKRQDGSWKLHADSFHTSLPVAG